MKRLISGLACTAVLGGTALASAPPVSAAKTYKACVKKSTGELRMTTKKCSKGWKRVSWTKSGPTGDKGPTGDAGRSNSMGTLVDASGAEVGLLLGAGNPGINMYTVLIDGGIYLYYPNGWLLPTLGMRYTSDTCTGTAYMTSASAEGRDEIMNAYGLRAVYRTSAGGVLGPPESYQRTGTYTTVFNQALWRRNDAGACVAEVGPFTGYLVAMEQVANGPTDRPGPLVARG